MTGARGFIWEQKEFGIIKVNHFTYFLVVIKRLDIINANAIMKFLISNI